MAQILSVAIGGAIGSIFRFLLAKKVQAMIQSAIPWGVLLVNFLGCFLIGLLSTLFLEKLQVSPVWRAGILIGFLGGFTTFSTFTNDAINLIDVGSMLPAVLYIFLSLSLCLIATWIGLYLARSL